MSLLFARSNHVSLVEAVRQDCMRWTGLGWVGCGVRKSGLVEKASGVGKRSDSGRQQPFVMVQKRPTPKRARAMHEGTDQTFFVSIASAAQLARFAGAAYDSGSVLAGIGAYGRRRRRQRRLQARIA